MVLTLHPGIAEYSDSGPVAGAEDGVVVWVLASDSEEDGAGVVVQEAPGGKIQLLTPSTIGPS